MPTRMCVCVRAWRMRRRERERDSAHTGLLFSSYLEIVLQYFLHLHKYILNNINISEYTEQLDSL